MKIYQVVVTFLEPAQGTISVQADSEEDACNIVRRRLEPHVSEVTIQSIELIVDDPSVDPSDMGPNRQIN